MIRDGTKYIEGYTSSDGRNFLRVTPPTNNYYIYIPDKLIPDDRIHYPDKPAALGAPDSILPDEFSNPTEEYNLQILHEKITFRPNGQSSDWLFKLGGSKITASIRGLYSGGAINIEGENGNIRLITELGNSNRIE